MKKGLDYVKSARFFVCPNEGFVKQLQIFEQLSWSACLDTLSNSQIYRSWLLESGNHPTTEEEAKTSLFIQTLKSGSKELARYRCIACRTDLFYDCHIQQHMNRAEKVCNCWIG
ncbi:unnamed protein product, partial [Mesorhabditis belari]|uniref:protein-tyrosine-phosphatase n=1 Tax=Mesorhabditis belari TaxID=2138241 RepID=A0AAF3FN93_9BILA